jgi:hypothetical protein
MLILPANSLVTAALTLSHELQDMTIYPEAGLARQPAFQCAEVTIGKINHGSAAGTNQVMVMLGRTPHQVAADVTADAYFTDQTQGSEYLQRAIDGHQPDTRVPPACHLVYCRRGEVLATAGNGAYDSAALRGNLITAPSQCALDLLLRNGHYKS